MRWNSEAVLVVDDDWLDADELRVFIKQSGIMNVPIAMSEGLVALASEYFSVVFIVMPERIKMDASHPLRKAISKHFPSTPVISFHEHVRREILLPEIAQRLGNKRSSAKRKSGD